MTEELLSTIANKYRSRIAYAVGYDIHDADINLHLTEIIKAGIQDMNNSGVSENVLENNLLVLTTLIIFVTDNINMTAGQFSTSPMYVTNVSKLRLIKDANH